MFIENKKSEHLNNETEVIKKKQMEIRTEIHNKEIKIYQTVSTNPKLPCNSKQQIQ